MVTINVRHKLNFDKFNGLMTGFSKDLILSSSVLPCRNVTFFFVYV